MLVAIAAIGGYVAGQGGVRGGGRTEREGADADRSGQSAKSVVSPRERRSSPEAEAATQRRAGVREMIEKFKVYDSPGDPFGDFTADFKDDSRVFAAIYQLEESDFPAVLDLCMERTKEDGVELDSEVEDFFDAMIRRWSDFSPGDALAWWREIAAKEGLSGGHIEMLIATEALDSDRDLVVGIVQKQLRLAIEDLDNPEPDPFANAEFEGFGGFPAGEGFPVTRPSLDGAEGYLYLLTRADPDFAYQSLLQEPDPMLDGLEGWLSAMFELKREGELPAMIANLPPDYRAGAMESYGEVYLERDPVGGKRWLDGFEAEEAWDLDRYHLNQFKEGSEQWLEAVEWTLNRAESTEEQNERFHQLVSGVVYREENADEIVAKLIELGFSRETAERGMFDGAVRRSNYQDAFRRIGAVSLEQRDEIALRLIDSSVDRDGFSLGEFSIYFHKIDDHDFVQVEAAGYGEMYRNFVRERNAKAMAALLKWAQEQGEGIPAQGGE